jgi:hypothetical protein
MITMRQAKNVQHLTLLEVNQLVAKLQGIRVEIYDGHVARRLPFSPEGPANAFAPNNECMWRFYEPTVDWSIAGPIIDEEGICTSYPSKASGEEKYSRAFYPDDDGDDVLHEYCGSLSCEAGMRSYIAKHLGSDVDLDDLPKIERRALVKVLGWTKSPIDVTDDDPDAYAEETLEVVAELREEAEAHAIATRPTLLYVEAHFIKWAGDTDHCLADRSSPSNAGTLADKNLVEQAE